MRIAFQISIASGGVEVTHLIPGVEVTHPPKHAYIWRKTMPKSHAMNHNPIAKGLWFIARLFRIVFLHIYICMFREVRHFHPGYQVSHFHPAWHYFLHCACSHHQNILLQKASSPPSGQSMTSLHSRDCFTEKSRKTQSHARSSLPSAQSIFPSQRERLDTHFGGLRITEK